MKRLTELLLVVSLTVAGIHCASTNATRRAQLRKDYLRQQQVREGRVLRGETMFYGKASFYGPQFHGKKTASGEVFNMYDLTAAHKTLPFGTRCRVTNLKNGKTVIVRINDRGPFVPGRIMDLSYGAAKALDAVADGIIEVKVEVLGE